MLLLSELFPIVRIDKCKADRSRILAYALASLLGIVEGTDADAVLVEDDNVTRVGRTRVRVAFTSAATDR